MTTVSRQSAFWAVVALGLNTFAQDGGKVLGFPAEWSRALRLSPIVCIVDTLGVLFSIAFFSYQTRSLKDGFTLAARHRCLTEDDPAKPKQERTWWFRSVFALVALTQAVKILGMSGIPLTKTWGMAYLVSFLVIEGLDLLQPRQHGDDAALEQHTAVLDKYMWFTGALGVYTQATCFMVEALLIPMAIVAHECDLEPSNSLPLPEPSNVKHVIIVEIMLTPYFFMLVLSASVPYMAISLFFEPIPGRSPTDSVEVIQILLLVATACLAGLGIVLKGSVSTCTFRVFFLQATALALLLTFLCTESTPKLRKLFGIQRFQRRGGSFHLHFASGNIVGIICYYVCIYDPSSTYKSPWTGFFG